MEEILSKLQDIYQDVLDNEDIELTLETTAEDIEEWDSLVHIQLITEISKVFNIKFTAKEIMSWDNIGGLISTIQSKLNA